MTVSLEKINSATDNWMDLFEKTNAAIDALVDKAITVNSNTTTGEAKLNGTLEATTLTAINIRGGTIGTPADINIHDITRLNANTQFQGANNSFGMISSIHALGANTTHKMVMGDNATGKFRYADLRHEITLIDGAGSGIDADMLDGENSTYYTDIVARLGYRPINSTGDLGITGALRTTSSVDVNGAKLSNSSTTGFRIENVRQLVHDNYSVLSDKQTIGATGTTNIFSVPLSSMQSAEIIFTVRSGNNVSVSKMLVSIDGSNNINSTEYATVNSSTKLGEFNFTVTSGSIVNCVVTGLSSGAVVTTHATLIAR